MESYKREFIEFLQEAGVLKFGDFTAKSGRKIPYFINAGQIKTGDEMNLGLWIGMLIMALAAMGILGVRRLIKKR